MRRLHVKEEEMSQSLMGKRKNRTAGGKEEEMEEGGFMPIHE